MAETLHIFQPAYQFVDGKLDVFLNERAGSGTEADGLESADARPPNVLDCIFRRFVSPARISVSCSLLTATMIQKSSLRENRAVS